MSSFIQSLIQAAPLVELLQKVIGLGDEKLHETVNDNESYWTVMMNYGVGPYGVGIWVSWLANVMPEFSTCCVGVRFGFCPDYWHDWNNAVIDFVTTLNNDNWKLSLEIGEPDPDDERRSKPPLEARQWYLDSAKTMIKDLGFKDAGVLKTDGLQIGDTVDVLPIIRKAVSIFSSRAKNVPFDADEYL